MDSTRQSTHRADEDWAIRSVIFQEHLQALIDRAGEASRPAPRAWRSRNSNIALDLATTSALSMHIWQVSIYFELTTRHASSYLATDVGRSAVTKGIAESGGTRHVERIGAMRHLPLNISARRSG